MYMYVVCSCRCRCICICVRQKNALRNELQSCKYGSIERYEVRASIYCGMITLNKSYISIYINNNIYIYIYIDVHVDIAYLFLPLSSGKRWASPKLLTSLFSSSNSGSLTMQQILPTTLGFYRCSQTFLFIYLFIKEEKKKKRKIEGWRVKERWDTKFSSFGQREIERHES